jgi:hypothetical protein
MGSMGPLFGFRDEGLGLLLGAGQDARRLLPRLLHGEVGRPLGQHQGSPQRFVIATDLGGRLLGPLRPLKGLTQTVLENFHARGHPLEELIHVLGVIPPHFLTELDFA